MTQLNRISIPQKGWRHIGVIDLGERIGLGERIEYEQCEYCNQERIRFVHILYHPEIDRELRVGCDCASKLTDDYVNPKEKEREYRNRAKRQKNFFQQEWKYKHETGNYTLLYQGKRITIIKSKYGGWGIVFCNETYWSYKNQKILDLDTAKMLAFELFDQS